MSIKKIVCVAALLVAGSCVNAQNLSTIEAKRVKLPDGWSLTPVGKSLPLGDLPLNIAISRTHRYAAVTNNGQSTQTIQLLDAKNDTQLDSVVIGKAWGGLAFSADEKDLYASGGDNNWIVRYAITNNRLVAADTIKLGEAWIGRAAKPVAISPAGLTIDDKKGILYVVTKQDNSLYLIDLKTKTVQSKTELGSDAYTTLSVIPVPDAKTLAVYSQAVYHNTPYQKRPGEKCCGGSRQPGSTKNWRYLAC